MTDKPIDVNDPQFVDALNLAMTVATPIARQKAAQSADGDFLQFLILLLKELLPIILELLKK